jgi:hypothetical protein
MTGSTAPTVSATPTLGDDLLADLKQAGSDALVTALKQYQSILTTAVQNVIATSDPQEALAQVLASQNAIVTGLPGLEQSEIHVLATDAGTMLTQISTAALSSAQGIAPTPPATA